MKAKVDKATEKPVQRETIALPHKQNLIPNQLEDWKRPMDSQVPDKDSSLEICLEKPAKDHKGLVHMREPKEAWP